MFFIISAAVLFIPVQQNIKAILMLLILSISFGIEIYLQFKTQKSVSGLVRKIEKIKDTISGTGEQISGSCNQIDESTQEQASAVTETSTASSEISSMIEMTSANVKKVSQSIDGINQIIRTSSDSTHELEKSFLDGKGASEHTVLMMNETVALLSELTTLFQDVVSKTAIINDIVFQTRLLSFNASVEAARAGEHGKGFSVVAEEIGNLAKMSGQSAQDINQTLDVTEKKVNFIIQKISASSKELSGKFQEQVQTTMSCLADFKNNFRVVQERTQSIGEELVSLSSAAIEQSKGVTEMSDAIHMVNESINRNTLVVAQTAKLANVLNDEILNLNKNIKGFKSDFHLDGKVYLDEIPWLDKYAIGVKEMDHEHQMILDRINRLIKAMNRDNVDEMVEAYNGLYDVTHTHFSHEEDHLISIGYPSFDSHKKIHENLLSKLLSFGGAIENNNLDKPMLASFLRNWLFTHIMGIDTKYAEYGRERHFHKKGA